MSRFIETDLPAVALAKAGAELFALLEEQVY